MRKVIKRALNKKVPILSTKISYKKHFRVNLNLKNPETFSEKIQYLKLFVFPKSEYIGQLADKYGVREYVRTIGLGHILTPIIGVFDTVSEINFNDLPKSFVAKKSNAAGYNLIVRDKSKVQLNLFKQTLTKFLNDDYGYLSEEKHYSNGLNKILIEPFLEINNDYKFFIFSGKVVFGDVIIREFNNACSNGFEIGSGTFHKCYYDRDGKPVFPEKDKGNEIPLSPKYFEMIEVAEKLAGKFPFVRVDLYLVKDKIFLSELTFTPSSGYNNYFKEEWQYKLGALINLNDICYYFAENGGII